MLANPLIYNYVPSLTGGALTARQGVSKCFTATPVRGGSVETC